MTSSHVPGPFDVLSPLHVPLLLQDPDRQKDTPSNRDWLCKHSGFAYKVCVAVPNMIFKNPPKFLNEKGEEQKDRVAKWKKADASHLWKQLVQEDLKHGWAIADATRLNPRISYNRGQSAGHKVYSSPQVLEIARDADGDIVTYFIEFDLEDGEVPTRTTQSHIKFELAAPVVFHVESNPQQNHLGISKLSKCWSHIIFAEWIAYLTVYVDCYMKPLLFFPMPPNTPDATKDSIQSQIEALPLLKALTGEFGPEGQSYKPEWIASAMETKFQEHLQVQLAMIASDAELPQRFLVGTQEGATASSVEDAKAVQESLESIFMLYEPYIRYWCEQNKIIAPGEPITIEPDVEVRVSEKDQAEIDQMNAQRAVILTKIITINEARAILKMPPTEGGDEVLGINEAKPLVPENVNFNNQSQGETQNDRKQSQEKGAGSKPGAREETA
jgi:hypothetical protein